MIKNKIEKPFGPGGSWTGIFMFIFGIIGTYYSPIGLIPVILGAFIGFTSTSTIIDINKRRARNLNYLFGIIPVGKWINIEYGMKLGLRKIHRGYSTSTRGNSLEVHLKDIRIILYSFDNKMIMSLKKSDSIEEAKKELVLLSNQLELVIIPDL